MSPEERRARRGRIFIVAWIVAMIGVLLIATGDWALAVVMVNGFSVAIAFAVLFASSRRFKQHLVSRPKWGAGTMLLVFVASLFAIALLTEGGARALPILLSVPCWLLGTSAAQRLIKGRDSGDSQPESARRAIYGVSGVILTACVVLFFVALVWRWGTGPRRDPSVAERSFKAALAEEYPRTRRLTVRCDDGPKGWDTFGCEVTSTGSTTRHYSIVWLPDMSEYEAEGAAHDGGALHFFRSD